MERGPPFHVSKVSLCPEKEGQKEPSEPFAPILSTLEEPLVRVKDGKITALSMHTSFEMVKRQMGGEPGHSSYFYKSKMVAASGSA